jgi:hydroxymethylglutaryl-CoA synthase
LTLKKTPDIMAKRPLPVGIDDMAFFAPQLYLDIRTLAEKRDIPYEKLSRGLGLIKMALPDVHEDAATMAAEAVAELLERNQIDPHRIGRLYFGTESALDMAKPTGTYTIEMLEQRFAPTYGPGCFRHCDVLDMTFACIGAVDALHNTLDWVTANPDQIGIVVAGDVAKYELGSTGEYTQGAGAVAMLVKANPRLLTVRNLFGVSTESVHDFFKPRREKFSETPVFDGQYSNLCFQQRMNDALDDFRRRAIATGLFREEQYRALSERWARLIFHLPYAFHARRMFVERYIQEQKAAGKWEKTAAAHGWQEPQAADFPDTKSYEKAQAGFLKAVSESKAYKKVVADKLEKAQRASMETGNLYTGSILLALMSTLECDQKEGAALAGKRLGFVAYGSGSKSKVFEGTLQPGWETIAAGFRVFDKLSERRAVSYEHYEQLHRYELKTPLHWEKGRWGLERIGTEGVTLGARYYVIK